MLDTSVISRGSYTAEEFLRKIGNPGVFCELADRVVLCGCSRYSPAQVANDVLQFVGRDCSEHILLVATCCGGYSNGAVEELKKAFPRVVWNVPAVGDYNSSPLPGTVANDFLKRGIVK